MKYSLSDLAKKLDVSTETLLGWLEKDLITPSISHTDMYGDAALRECEAVKKFLTMGYSIAEIAKIRREIGLPVKETSRPMLSRIDDSASG